MKNILPAILSFSFLLISFGISAQCFSVQNYTNPGLSTFVIPGEASEFYLIEIETNGADGGDFLWGGNPQTDGGSGASMKGSFVVPGGSELLIIVGESGFDAPGSPGGGGGGGGSAVIINNTDVLIAAGAGGGGGQGASNTGEGGLANTNSSAIGGEGLGSAGGGGFNAAGGDGPISTGGGAGTLFGLGAGGMGGLTAGSGGSGFGGGGGGSGTVGGGGGGYQGGDGSDGSTDKNGKGGDSFFNSLYASILIFNTAGINGGGSNIDGSVTITCIPQGDVEISLVEAIEPLCFGSFGGSIEVEAIGGLEPYQYALNGGIYGNESLFTGLAAGDYTVAVKDGAGVTDLLTVTLTSPSMIIGEIVNVIDNVCFGGSTGSIEVTASGGTSTNSAYGYSINGSAVQTSGLFSNLPNGFYVISIFDDNLCTAQVTTSIDSPEDLDIIETSKTNISCFGLDDGSCAVAAFGGTGVYFFSIDNGPFSIQSQFINLSGGTHIIIVMDEEGCTEELIVFIDEPDDVTFDLVASELLCFGDENGMISVVNVEGTPPFQYKLNDEVPSPDPFFTGLSSGDYDVTVIDSSGCEYIQDITILSPDSLILIVDVVMEVQCGDSTGAVQLVLENAIGTVTYGLNQTFNFSGLFENLAAGEYEATVTDSFGCYTEVLFEIQESATFNIEIDSIKAVDCYGGSDGSILLSVTEGIEPIQYAINGIDYQDTAFFDGLMAGEYIVSVMDSTGCVNELDVTIDEPTQMQFAHIDINNVACYGDNSGSIEFSIMGGTPIYSYIDSDIGDIFDVNDTLVFDFLTADETIVMIYDDNACLFTDTILISQNDSLVLFVSELTEDNCGPDFTGNVDLNAVGGYAPLTITIDSVSNMNGEFDSLMYGDYSAILTDDLGCNVSLDFNIPLEEGLILDSTSFADVTCFGAEDGFVEFFISNAETGVYISEGDILHDSMSVSNLGSGWYSFTATDIATGCFLMVDVQINEPDLLDVSIFDVNISNDPADSFIEVRATGGTQPFQYSIDDKVTFQDSAIFTNLASGEYIIYVQDANGCSDSVKYELVSVVESDLVKFNIYPNPASDRVHIDFVEPVFANVNIELRSLTGEKVISFNQSQIERTKNGINIELDEMQSGSYIIVLTSKSWQSYNKIVIIN